jgi:Protein of unknown function (DUF1566)
VVAGLYGCRSNKQASVDVASHGDQAGAGANAAQAGSGGNVSAGEHVAPWATWPMPNSAPGLPNPQSFDTQTAGVVVDRVTGLMWQRDLDGKEPTLAEATQMCAALTLASYDDWRLPSRIELVSILDNTHVQPSINLTAFPQTAIDWYWTSTLAADDPQKAWYVYFYFGYPQTDLVSNQFSARCVRPLVPHAAPATRYDVQADTVRDVATGLTWQRAVPADTFALDAARNYCSVLNLAGKQGWRLPSSVELLTLIDERADSPMIDRVAFPNTPGEPFWSTTDFGGVPGMAWQIYFDRGNGLYGLPNATFRVRCVI